ncbi:MAG: metallophosphoesterase [Planctomycetaceae bacterium]
MPNTTRNGMSIMKIAVTADVHLTTRGQHPERYNALASILERVEELGTSQLIIAGDLFDHNVQDYSEFEELCTKHAGVNIHVIPGNHDPGLKASHIVSPNVRVYSEPTIVDMGMRFLFVPFRTGLTMGEAVAPDRDQLESQAWVLVGHGDYCGGSRRANPYEPGTYMPLSRSDVERFRPRTVLLGHIHLSIDETPIHYPGSPCGLDISETGQRRFLIYDTNTGTPTPQTIQTDVIFFQETFTIVPRADEVDRLKEEIQRRIEGWSLDDVDLARAQVRVEARGFCLDRQAISDTLASAFRGIAKYKNASPDVGSLSVSTNGELEWLASRVEQLIDEVHLPAARGSDEPERAELIDHALRVIYGEGGVA